MPYCSSMAMNTFASYSLPLSEWNIIGCGWWKSAFAKCLHGERRSLPRPHMEAHQLSREEIDDGTHVDLLSMERELGEIRCPDMVWI